MAIQVSNQNMKVVGSSGRIIQVMLLIQVALDHCNLSMLYVGVLYVLYMSKHAKCADFSTIGIFVKFLMWHTGHCLNRKGKMVEA